MAVVSRQQVFLTGTLPPSRVKKFTSLFRLQTQETRVIRNKCTRDNLKYDYIDTDVEFRCPRLVKEMVAKAKTHQRRAIIFILSRLKCNYLAFALNIPKFYAYMTPKSRKSAIDTWTSKYGAIVATTAMA